MINAGSRSGAHLIVYMEFNSSDLPYYLSSEDPWLPEFSSTLASAAHMPSSFQLSGIKKGPAASFHGVDSTDFL